MLFVYHVFVEGSSNPVWTYKTWHGLFTRLRELAKHSALGAVRVEYRQRFGPSTQYDLGALEQVQVTFQRSPYSVGWQTPVGQGIRHDELGNISAWSVSHG